MDLNLDELRLCGTYTGADIPRTTQLYVENRMNPKWAQSCDEVVISMNFDCGVTSIRRILEIFTSADTAQRLTIHAHMALRDYRTGRKSVQYWFERLFGLVVSRDHLVFQRLRLDSVEIHFAIYGSNHHWKENKLSQIKHLAEAKLCLSNPERHVLVTFADPVSLS